MTDEEFNNRFPEEIYVWNDWPDSEYDNRWSPCKPSGEYARYIRIDYTDFDYSWVERLPEHQKKEMRDWLLEGKRRIDPFLKWLGKGD